MFQRIAHVAAKQVAVPVERERNGRMTGQLLGHLGGNAGSRKVGNELVPQGMEVEDLPLLVPLRKEIRFLATRRFVG